jgi:hypothetical protein
VALPTLWMRMADDGCRPLLAGFRPGLRDSESRDGMANRLELAQWSGSCEEARSSVDSPALDAVRSDALVGRRPPGRDARALDPDTLNPVIADR